ncbi:MAG: hypothetical protein P4L53_23050 [Candidatus Obscuribacterales bacterium]|nr:hypothetical protein [Candidatus Obscuribacterales bacterium]
MGRKGAKKNKLGVRSSSGNMAEFPLVIYVSIILFTVPIIDLLGVATGMSAVCLVAHESASRAADQRRYADSLSGAQQSATAFLGSGIAKFARMKPIGGYQNSGINLFIDASSIAGSMQTFGPNTPLTVPVDTSANVYQCRIDASYEIGPTIPMSFVPVLADVPGLGKPLTVSFNANRTAEYPNGLEQLQNSSSTPMTAFNNVASPSGAFKLPYDTGWNNGHIFQDIAAAGQTVLSDNVIQVRANNPNWTDSQLNIKAGQTLWIDLRADGAWTTTTNNGQMVDANGFPGFLCQNPQSHLIGAPVASLIGQVGSNQPFVVGENFQSYVPGAGEFQLVIDDGGNPTPPGVVYQYNAGSMAVRVIVAQ